MILNVTTLIVNLTLNEHLKLNSTLDIYEPTLYFTGNIDATLQVYNVTYFDGSWECQVIFFIQAMDTIIVLNGYVHTISAGCYAEYEGLKKTCIMGKTMACKADMYYYPYVTPDSFTNGSMQITHTHYKQYELFPSNDYYSCQLRVNERYWKTIEIRMSDFSWTNPHFPLNVYQDYKIKKHTMFIESECYKIYPLLSDFSSDSLTLPNRRLYLQNGDYSNQQLNLIKNTTQVCIGLSVDDCQVVTLPTKFEPTEQEQSIFWGESVMLGFNYSQYNYENEDYFVGAESDTSSYLKYFKINACTRFLASTQRALAFNHSNSLTGKTTYVINFAFSYLDSEEVEWFSTGYYCGNISFQPAILLTSDDGILQQFCAEQQANLTTHGLSASICSTYSFSQTYSVQLCLTVCGLIGSAQLALFLPMFANSKHRSSTKFQYAILLLIIGIVIWNLELPSTISQLAIVLPFVLWVTQMILNYSGNVEKSKDDGLTYWQIVFTKSRKYGFKEKLNVLSVIFLMYLFKIPDALFMFSNVSQCLNVFKIDTSATNNSFLFFIPNIFLEYGSLVVTFPTTALMQYVMTFAVIGCYVGSQYIVRSTWFSKCWKEENEDAIVDWGQIPLYLFLWFISEFQNFCAIAIQTTQNNLLQVDTLSSPFTQATYIFITIFFSCYLYSFTKFNMIPKWWKSFKMIVVQIAKEIVLIFVVIAFCIIRFVQGLIMFPIYPFMLRKVNDPERTFIGILMSIGDPVFTALEVLYLVMIIIMQLITFGMYPILLFFTDFLPPFNFILFAIGAIPAQDEIRKSVKQVQHENFEASIIRVVVSIALYLFLTCLNNYNQNTAVWVNTFYFVVAFVPTIIQRFLETMQKSMYHRLLMKEKVFHYRYVFPELSAALYRVRCILMKYENYLLPLEEIDADYDRDPGKLGGFLKGQVPAGLQFLPAIGTLLGSFAGIMGGPALIDSGEMNATFGYVDNFINFLLQLATIVACIYFPGNAYLYIFAIDNIFILQDALDEAHDFIPGCRMMYLNDVFTCGQKEEEEEDEQKVIKKFHIPEEIKKKFKMSIYAGKTLVANRFVFANNLVKLTANNQSQNTQSQKELEKKEQSKSQLESKQQLERAESKMLQDGVIKEEDNVFQVVRK